MAQRVLVEALAAAFLAMTTTSIFAGTQVPWVALTFALEGTAQAPAPRANSRTTRFTRLRATALPTFLLTVIPNRPDLRSCALLSMRPSLEALLAVARASTGADGSSLAARCFAVTTTK